MEHYVYRITNLKLKKYYYGTRTTKFIAEEDIGIRYFSSSYDKEFIKDQKENPQNYKYKILNKFNNRRKALELEIKLHTKFNVGINESFYNRSKQTSIGFDTTGIKYSEERKNKIKENLANNHPKGMKGKKHTEGTKKRIAESTKKSLRESMSYPVFQYNLDGIFIRKFDYIGAAKDFFGVNSAIANIVKAIDNPHRKYKESLWRKEFIDVEPYIKPKMVWYYDPETKESIRVNENKPNYKNDIPDNYLLGWGRYK